MKRGILLIIQLICFTSIHAQIESHEGYDYVLIGSSSPQTLDSCIIYPPSVQIFHSDSTRLTAGIDFEIKENKIHFLQDRWQKGQSFYLTCDCVNTLGLEKSQSLLDTTILEDSYRLIQSIEPEIGSFDPFNNGRGLQSSGVFSRSIGIGNNQNLVLNSTFNLQLQGDIGDGIKINAAISDANIPIQPEGNTQQLNEFDRVFIELSKKQSTLLLGDYQQQNKSSYFLKYFKKMQGVQFTQDTFDLGKGQLDMQSSFAITKGKFARNTFFGTEGNQGPYKLRGAEGESFIIILANTERVFIDGKLLKRGFDNDYIIDYNAGTITFTVRQPMTTEKRIIIEFEYNDQSYLRSVYTFHTNYYQNNFHLYANVYGEQDGLSKVGEGPLNAEQLAALAQAGDNPLLASTPALDTTGSSTNPIRYQLIDTIINGTPQEILVYFPGESTDFQLYNANFTNLGAGNGRYEQSNIDANGIVYTFVGFDSNGQPLGSYEPVKLIDLPQARKLINLGLNQKIGNKGFFNTELALSEFDKNKVSNLDNMDNWGMALFTQAEKEIQISEAWDIEVEAKHEWKQENFRAIIPYRNPEFVRDWALGNNTTQLEPQEEHLGRGLLMLGNDKKGFQVNYEFGTLIRGNQYRGIKHVGQLQYQNNGWDIQATSSVLNSTDQLASTQFSKPVIAVSKRLGKNEALLINVNWFEERNESIDLLADTLLNRSFSFNQAELRIELPEKHNFTWSFYGQNRRDFRPVEQDLVMWKNAYTTGLETNLKGFKNTQLNTQISYRIFDDVLQELPEENGQFMGKMNWNQKIFGGMIRLTTLYQLTSGREQKLQFFYQQVNPGEGIYMHLDFNDDGTEQASEFVLAPTPDQGTHIRVIYYSDEFIRTDNALFNQNVDISPKALWYDETGFKKVLSYLSIQSNWQMEQKVQDKFGTLYWHPLQQNIAEGDIVNDRTNIRNNLWINRGGRKLDVQFSQIFLDVTNLLTTGLESKTSEEWSSSVRWNVGEKVSLRFTTAVGEKSVSIEQYADRSFEVNTQKIVPEISIFPNENSRLIFKHESIRFQSLNSTEEAGSIQKISLESQVSQEWGLVEANINFAQVDYSGDANSAIGFALLNGLQKDINYQWTLGVNRKINKNLRLGLQYEGRKNGNQSIVHTGNIQFSAFF